MLEAVAICHGGLAGAMYSKDLVAALSFPSSHSCHFDPHAVCYDLRLDESLRMT